MMPKTYPPKKHHVVHVSCFDDASGGETPEFVTQEKEVVKDTTPQTPSDGEIDVRDWK